MIEDWRDLYADDDFDYTLSNELEDVDTELEYHRERLVLLKEKRRRLEAQMPKDAVAEALEIAAAAWAKEAEDDRRSNSENAP
jgi:hypothetical protein